MLSTIQLLNLLFSEIVLCWCHFCEKKLQLVINTCCYLRCSAYRSLGSTQLLVGYSVNSKLQWQCQFSSEQCYVLVLGWWTHYVLKILMNVSICCLSCSSWWRVWVRRARVRCALAVWACVQGTGTLLPEGALAADVFCAAARGSAAAVSLRRLVCGAALAVTEQRVSRGAPQVPCPPSARGRGGRR